jgi:hypothetical protein
MWKPRNFFFSIQLKRKIQILYSLYVFAYVMRISLQSSLLQVFHWNLFSLEKCFFHVFCEAHFETQIKFYVIQNPKGNFLYMEYLMCFFLTVKKIFWWCNRELFSVKGFFFQILILIKIYFFVNFNLNLFDRN